MNWATKLFKSIRICPSFHICNALGQGIGAKSKKKSLGPIGTAPSYSTTHPKMGLIHALASKRACA